MKFILSKKHIILTCLVLILGVAVYLNWSFANKGKALENTFENDYVETNTEDLSFLDESLDEQAQTNEETTVNNEVTQDDVYNPTQEEVIVNEETDKAGQPVNADADDDKKTKYLGDAQFVNGQIIAQDTYFVKAKLLRDQSRDKAIETISTILQDASLTQTDKQEATLKALNLTDLIEVENKIENLIKAKGFEECMVYINDDSASIVVKSEGLDGLKATQIKNIVVSESTVKGEKVSITEVY
ncbi:MAG: SpoIIIAH-like family protein [Oscillospiraceae bacterium]